MKIAAIVNPRAGWRQVRREWPELLKRLRTRGAPVETWWTHGPGHAEFLAARAKKTGVDRVLAVGGDGTLFEVANGLWWEPEGNLPSLGIVPLGSGCDYIRNFEVGSGLGENLVRALGEATVTVDLGVSRLRDRHGKIVSRVFLNTLGIGFDAQVTGRYRQQKILRYWKLPYLLSALQELSKLRHFRWRGQIDRQDYDGRSLIFVTGLGRYFGGGIMITPRASPQGGRFQMVWDRDLSGLELLRLLPRIYRGRHLDHPKAQSCLAQRLQLTAEPAAPVEADGEVMGWTPVEVEVYPRALEVAAAGCLTDKGSGI
jgi:diacylglycerol kinase (ATP)